MLTHFVRAATLAGVLAFAGTAQAITIESTFDVNLEGWTVGSSAGFAETGPFTHVVSGGNPGGYARLDNCECAIAQINAPTAFLGNLSAFIGGLMSFDGNLLGNGGGFFDGPGGSAGTLYLDYGIITIKSPTLTAQIDLLPGGATAPFQAWATYAMSMTAAAWGMSTSDFANLMGNVTSLSITIEALFGPEVQGIDNVRLVSAATDSAPAPGALALLALGLLGFGAVRRRH